MDENPYKSPESVRTDGRSSIEKALDKIDKLFDLRNWRIGAMLCVVIPALFSPWKDPLSLGLVAIPLVFLYFFGIGLRAVALLLLKGKDGRYMVWAWFLFLLVALVVLVLPR